MADVVKRRGVTGRPYSQWLCRCATGTESKPAPAQQHLLARVFGCCRVVFNDALRVCDQAYRAGIKLSDSEIQRRVITAAKTSAERHWLAEVPSVVLVQSVNDSRRAWRNFFDSHTGSRRGRHVGRPRLKSRTDHRQSFRFTRNGFRVRRSGRLFVAKIGEVPVRWSRELPSEPSSVTIIREPDGHFYASFVVEVPQAPLQQVQREAGADLGIARLATVAGTDGRRTDIANPKHLGGKVRKLRRLEREKSRRQKAAHFGRTVHTVSRWLASSKTCSACGHRLDELPLQVRQWLCPACLAHHDRDHNAAMIILAAGRGE
jgi:putative transposase